MRFKGFSQTLICCLLLICSFQNCGKFQVKTWDSGSNSDNFLNASAEKGASGIVTDATGNIYIVESANSRVVKLAKSGAFLLSFGSQGQGNGQFRKPIGITIDKTGNLLVTDTGNHRIQKFSQAGVFISSFGTFGPDPGQFNSPEGIAVDDANNIFVTDHTTATPYPGASDQAYRVQKFNFAGEYLVQINDVQSRLEYETGAPFSISISGNSYFVANGNNYWIHKSIRDDALISGAWDSAGSTYIAVAGNDKFLFIADYSKNCIYRKTIGDNSYTQITFELGQHFKPTSLTLDGDGNLLVIDSGVLGLKKFSQDGTFLE